jgi:hypothetical protein
LAQHNYAAAQVQYEAGIALFWELGDLQGIAAALADADPPVQPVS